MLQPDPHDVLASLVYMVIVFGVLYIEWRVWCRMKPENAEAPAPRGGQQ